MSHILIADDEDTVLRLIKRVLAGKPHELTFVDNVVDAEMKINSGHYDLLVSDVRFPKGDGVALAGVFRKKFPQGKIILISGSLGLERLMSQSNELGISESIAKPFDIETMEAAILKALGGGS